MFRRTILNLSLLFLFFSCQDLLKENTFVKSENELFNPNAEVIKVIDGDSFIITNENNEKVTVRLEGIDAPEFGQTFFAEAKEFVSDEVLGEQVFLEVKTEDRYGRLVANIKYLDKYESDTGVYDLSSELLYQGLAWHYKKYSENESLEEIERNAKENQINIWSEENPTPPWEWRKDQKKRVHYPNKKNK